jgi:hypothetical protein
MWTFAVNELTDLIIGKKLIQLVDGDKDITPPYNEIKDNNFVITSFESFVSDIYDDPFGHGNKIGEMPYIIIKNQTGISLYCENKPGVIINVTE